METLAELHPIAVHFPVAILLLYCFFELLEFFWKPDKLPYFTNILLFIGVIGAVFSALTGNQAAQVINQSLISSNILKSELINQHETFATITLWFFVLLLIIRSYYLIKKKFYKTVKVIIFILALTGGILVYYTGHLGGELVFKHGIGVHKDY